MLKNLVIYKSRVQYNYLLFHSISTWYLLNSLIYNRCTSIYIKRKKEWHRYSVCILQIEKISQHIFLSIIYKCNTTHTHKCAFSIQHITQKTIYLNVYRSKQYFLSSLQFIKNSLERDSNLLFLSFCFLNIKSYHKEYYN